MVLNIGLYGAAGYLAFPRQSVQTGRALGDMTRPEPPPMLNRRPPDFAKAGFGEGSVSVPGAAIRTIRRGVESAREVVPTVEDLRRDLRARLSRDREARKAEAEQRHQAERAQRAEEAPDPVKTAAAAINVSFGGSDAKGGASLQINGQITRYPAFNEQAAPQPSPALDIRA
ncbi:MAG TPA: hypothetical protein VMZ06_01190 [Candidatus Bathyarchaeia archaeon]|nr:hypothetical protein [Candidatus Bathyarchaeia archaeon]